MTRERALVIAGGCRIYGDWLARWVAEIALQAAAEGAAAEREACAKIAASWTDLNRVDGAALPDWGLGAVAEQVSLDIAAKIRARGKA